MEKTHTTIWPPAKSWKQILNERTAEQRQQMKNKKSIEKSKERHTRSRTSIKTTVSGLFKSNCANSTGRMTCGVANNRRAIPCCTKEFCVACCSSVKFGVEVFAHETPDCLNKLFFVPLIARISMTLLSNASSQQGLSPICFQFGILSVTEKII